MMDGAKAIPLKTFKNKLRKNTDINFVKNCGNKLLKEKN